MPRWKRRTPEAEQWFAERVKPMHMYTSKALWVDGKAIEYLEASDGLWFHGGDVGDVLGYRRIYQSVRALQVPTEWTCLSPGIRRDPTYASLRGKTFWIKDKALRALAHSSHKPRACMLRNWIVNELRGTDRARSPVRALEVRHETQVYEYLRQHFADVERERVISFTPVKGTHASIDFVVRYRGFLFYVECDEHQHKQGRTDYTVDGEVQRMLKVFAVLTLANPGARAHFIRFNPDRYTEDGIPMHTPMDERLAHLQHTLRTFTDNGHPFSVTYLYYDSEGGVPNVVHHPNYASEMQACVQLKGEERVYEKDLSTLLEEMTLEPRGYITRLLEAIKDCPKEDIEQTILDFDAREKTRPSPVIHFGKYKGKTVEEVAQEDWNYLMWVVNQDWVHDNIKDAIRSLE